MKENNIVDYSLETGPDFCGGAEDEPQYCTVWYITPWVRDKKTNTFVRDNWHTVTRDTFAEALEYCRERGCDNPRVTCSSNELMDMINKNNVIEKNKYEKWLII